MEKYIKFIPLALFCSFVIKGLMYGVSYVDTSVYLVLGAMAAFFEWKLQYKRMEVLHVRMDEIDKHLTNIYKSQEELKSHVASAKLASTYRPTSVAK